MGLEEPSTPSTPAAGAPPHPSRRSSTQLETKREGSTRASSRDRSTIVGTGNNKDVEAADKTAPADDAVDGVFGERAGEDTVDFRR